MQDDVRGHLVRPCPLEPPGAQPFEQALRRPVPRPPASRSAAEPRSWCARSSRKPSSLSNDSSAPETSSSWIQRLMSAWLAAGEHAEVWGALRRARRAHRAAEHRRQAGPPERPAQLERGAVDRAGDVVGQRRDGCRLDDRRRRAARRRRTSRSPSPASPRSARRPAGAGRRGLGEADEPVGAGERLALVASEQRVDSLGRVGRWVGHLDLHRTARVEAAAHEPDLLEHSDEHAWIGLVAELLRRDLGAAAQPRIDRAEVVDGRDVRAREPAQLLRVGPAREQERVRGAAVAAGPADHLHVALERLGVVVERHEADVGLVDPHPEGGRRHDRLDPALDEGLLRGRALGRLEARRGSGRPPDRGRAACAPGSRSCGGSARRRSPTRRAARAAGGRASAAAPPRRRRSRRRSGGSGRTTLVRTISGSRPRATAISRSVAGVAVAVIPRIAGFPRASRARRMKR